MNKKMRSVKVSDDWYSFIEKFGINRIRAGTDNKIRNLCDLPDIIMNYFKLNNDKYLEVVNMEVGNGNK